MKNEVKTNLILFICFLLPAILFGNAISSSSKTKMGGYYDIKILAINQAEASVKMHVRMFNPDGSRIYDSVGFGLQLLNNGKWRNSLISEEISFDDLLNPEWCQKYANGFVKSVVKVQQSSDPPIAILTIHCTDAAWLSHLAEGEEWESVAYEVALQYDPCEPILYEKEESSIPDVDESLGWMPVPSFLFEQGSYRLPNVVFLPNFTESSYFIKDTLQYEPETAHLKLSELHGKYIKDLKNHHNGIFVWDSITGKYAIESIGRDYRGGGGRGDYRDIGKVGILALKPNFKRRIQRMNYSDLFRWERPVIKSVQRKERFITLVVTGIYDIDALELNKARVLKMICNNFAETYNYLGERDSNFPLSRLLKYFAQKEGYDVKAILSKVADGIILNYSYEYPDEYIEDYDSMDRESLVEYFQNERWPCFKFHIELSDEVFGQQLDQVTQTVIPIILTYVSGDLEHWEQPILWKDYEHLMEK